MKISLPIFVTFAFRSLSRNLTRSLLSIIGVSIGCSLALIDLSMIRAEVGLYMKHIAEGGVGHFRIAPNGWELSHDSALRLQNWQRDLREVRSSPDVRVATPRARMQAMLSMGTQMAGVEIVGVDPETEPKAYRYVQKMESGRYLRVGDSHQMVIGKSIADRLKIGVGDSVVVTAVDRTGEMKSEMFDILGIVNLGSKQIESTICQMNLNDLELLSGLNGASEIVVVLDKPKFLQRAMNEIAPKISAGDGLLRWDEILPEARFAVVMHEIWGRLLTLILVFVAFVGVASAQLTAILERQKEFAILSAIGMSRKRVVSLIMSEAAILGTLSFLTTILLSGPLIYFFSKSGFRLLRDSQSFTVIGTIIDPIFYVDFGSWFFGYAALLCYSAMFFASIYPAVFTTRLDPLKALRVAQ